MFCHDSDAEKIFVGDFLELREHLNSFHLQRWTFEVVRPRFFASNDFIGGSLKCNQQKEPPQS